jgi:hypothetical protein
MNELTEKEKAFKNVFSIDASYARVSSLDLWQGFDEAWDLQQLRIGELETRLKNLDENSGRIRVNLIDKILNQQSKIDELVSALEEIRDENLYESEMKYIATKALEKHKKYKEGGE